MWRKYLYVLPGIYFILFIFQIIVLRLISIVGVNSSIVGIILVVLLMFTQPTLQYQRLLFAFLPYSYGKSLVFQLIIPVVLLSLIGYYLDTRAVRSKLAAKPTRYTRH